MNFTKYLGKWLRSLFPAAKPERGSFCIQPFRHIYLLPNGHIKPCCVFDGAIRDYEGPMSIERVSAADIWDSAHMRRVRSKMVNNLPVEECRYCYQQEAMGAVSPGENVTGAWVAGWVNTDALTPTDFRKSAAESGLRAVPETMDIVLGSTCNLKCRHCFSDSSSAIAGDAVHSAWAPLSSSPFVPTEGKVVPWPKRKASLMTSLLRDPEQFKSIALGGGETLIMKEAQDLMQHLIDTGAAERIALSIYTNATVISDAWFELAAGFKTLGISVSIDGIGTTYDYIRYPATWQMVSAGFQRLQSLTNATLCITMVVQAYNMLNVVEVSRFCEAVGVPLFPYALQEPSHLSSFIMPASIRREAARRLRAYAESSEISWHQQLLDLADAWETAPEREPALLHRFMVFSNDLDASRGQDFGSIFPELLSMLNAAGIEWTTEQRFAG